MQEFDEGAAGLEDALLCYGMIDKVRSPQLRWIEGKKNWHMQPVAIIVVSSALFVLPRFLLH